MQLLLAILHLINMKAILFISSLLLHCATAFGQSVVVQTADVNNFWIAFDSLKAETDLNKHEQIIRRLYFDKATPGLSEFIKLRDWTPHRFIETIAKHPAFWQTVRHKTLEVNNNLTQIRQLFKQYKKIYKNFAPPEIYFVMGYIETGGTTTQKQVLIGTEIAAADSTVNTKGLHHLVQSFIKSNKGAFSIVAHELTHTQQKGGDLGAKRNTNLLGLCLAEGSCEFIAELLLKQHIDRPYMAYGKVHQTELWDKFKREMHQKNTADWLYNGGYKKEGDADLGYYIGYTICKAYYEQARNKKKAIRQIIELEYENTAMLDSFIKKSRLLL